MAANGRLSKKQLAAIKGGGYLRKDAAKAWNAFARFAKTKGYSVQVTDSYRPLGAPGDLARGRWSQWAAWERYKQGGNLAANPGTSNHGWGLAVDVPSNTQQAIANHGAAFGWQKKWSDAQSEPWHFKWSPENTNREAVARYSQVFPGEVIQRGDRGPGVVSLKKHLREHGAWPLKYSRGNPIFGRTTQWWVKRFQKKKGLKADGVVGPSTWRALRAKVKKPPTPLAPKPKPEPRPKPKAKRTKGIDISNNNGSDLDFAKVKKAGYDWVIHKATEGDWVDPTFTKERVAAMRKAGLKVGAYVFLRPKQGRSGAWEARHLYKVAKASGWGKIGDISLVIDIEVTALTRAETYRYVRECAEELTKLQGCKPVIYTGRWFWDPKVTTEGSSWGCPLWLAAYVPDTNVSRFVPESWNDWTIWQYTDKAQVPGVGKCDANVAKRLPTI